MVVSDFFCTFVIGKENKTMKHIKRISCETCIKYHFCSGLMCDPECWQGKKTTSMEEKIAKREEIARFRRKVSKMYK